jgi:hypothetical protein
VPEPLSSRRNAAVYRAHAILEIQNLMDALPALDKRGKLLSVRLLEVNHPLFLFLQTRHIEQFFSSCSLSLTLLISACIIAAK